MGGEEIAALSNAERDQIVVGMHQRVAHVAWRRDRRDVTGLSAAAAWRPCRVCTAARRKRDAFSDLPDAANNAWDGALRLVGKTS
jgi:hypothetical protein